MPFASKTMACTKAGKVKKGFKKVTCKNGSEKYMTDNKPVKKVAKSVKVKKEPKHQKQEHDEGVLVEDA